MVSTTWKFHCDQNITSNRLNIKMGLYESILYYKYANIIVNIKFFFSHIKIPMFANGLMDSRFSTMKPTMHYNNPYNT